MAADVCSVQVVQRATCAGQKKRREGASRLGVAAGQALEVATSGAVPTDLARRQRWQTHPVHFLLCDADCSTMAWCDLRQQHNAVIKIESMNYEPGGL